MTELHSLQKSLQSEKDTLFTLEERMEQMVSVNPTDSCFFGFGRQKSNVWMLAKVHAKVKLQVCKLAKLQS
eukprot:COSAG04_NODE_270_length_18507_cov_125.250380_14_plen_71_part_00